MTTAHDILRFKGRTVHCVRPDDSVLTALGVMAEHDIGAVLVVEGDELLGLLTERDYARKVALMGRASRDSPVRASPSASLPCWRKHQRARARPSSRCGRRWQTFAAGASLALCRTRR